MLHWLARSEVGEPLKANPTKQDGLEPESPIVRIKKSPDVMSGHIWGERSGSNRRQPVPQTGALPTELRSPSMHTLLQTFPCKVKLKIHTAYFFFKHHQN